jgi:hypothetical protein
MLKVLLLASTLCYSANVTKAMNDVDPIIEDSKNKKSVLPEYRLDIEDFSGDSLKNTSSHPKTVNSAFTESLEDFLASSAMNLLTQGLTPKFLSTEISEIIGKIIKPILENANKEIENQFSFVKDAEEFIISNLNGKSLKSILEDPQSCQDFLSSICTSLIPKIKSTYQLSDKKAQLVEVSMAMVPKTLGKILSRTTIALEAVEQRCATCGEGFLEKILKFLGCSS